MFKGIQYIFLVLLVCNLRRVKLQSDDTASDTKTVVSDGTEEHGRDDDSMAKTAIVVTTVVSSIALLLCCGTMGFCVYQKCCVEECII